MVPPKVALATFSEGILHHVAFCTIIAISRQKESRSRDYALLLFRMKSRVLYSACYHRQHCTRQAFEQVVSLYMHNHGDKHPAWSVMNLVPPRYKAQSIRMRHRGRPPRSVMGQLSQSAQLCGSRLLTISTYF